MGFDGVDGSAGVDGLQYGDGRGGYAGLSGSAGQLAVVPEPSTYAMALAGLACGGYSMLRRRKRA
jgi:hypothetical protein